MKKILFIIFIGLIVVGKIDLLIKLVKDMNVEIILVDFM